MMDNNPDYKVIKITNSSGYDTQRGAHRTKQVHFRHSDGTMDYVELPLDQFTPENVQQLVQQATEVHRQVKALAPGITPPSSSPEFRPFG